MSHFTVRILVLTLSACLLTSPALRAQRIQFPSPSEETTASADESTAARHTTTRVQLAQGSGTRPNTLPPNLLDESAPLTPATPAPPSNFDPYAAPTYPPSSGGYLEPIQPPGTGFSQPAALSWLPWPEKLQRVSFTYELLVPERTDFGINSFDFNASFPFRFLYDQAPLVVTPGFTMHLWEGPNGIDIPPQVYDLYTDFNWRPQLGPAVGFDLSFQPTLSTDFDNTGSEMWRFPARALGLINITQRHTLVMGVIYEDRRQIGVVPSGGVIWIPNQDTRFEILFPHPKAAWRLPSIGNTDWWWYVRGGYGGGNWAIEREISGIDDEIDYFDLRLLTGVEWDQYQGHRGFAEMGWAFDREIEFRRRRDFKPSDTLILRAGLSY